MPKRFISEEERRRRVEYQRQYRAAKSKDPKWKASEALRKRVSNICIE
jgi:hypothetical protein